MYLYQSGVFLAAYLHSQAGSKFSGCVDEVPSITQLQD
jgi:hypothetical protein